jgi:hypothetical protein
VLSANIDSSPPAHTAVLPTKVTLASNKAAWLFDNTAPLLNSSLPRLNSTALTALQPTDNAHTLDRAVLPDAYGDGGVDDQDMMAASMPAETRGNK